MAEPRMLGADEVLVPRAAPAARMLGPEEVVQPAAARMLGKDEKLIQGFGTGQSFARGANVGIAEFFGAPVDIANFALGLVGLDSPKPIGGQRFIREAFSRFGISPPPGEEDPDSFSGAVGRITGASAAALFPVGPAAKFAGQVARNLRAAPTTIPGRFVREVGETAIRRPGRFIAGETAAAAAAGAGGFIARERFPDSEAASVIGEIIGGLTPAAGVGVARVLPTVLGARVARAVVRPFTKSGAQVRGERRVRGAARDPEQAAAQLAEPDVLPEARLTPAQLAGDEGLLSLERAVIDSSEQLKGEADEQIAQATTVIRESLADLGEGVSIEKTAETIEQARAYLNSLAETRVRIAARRADEQIAALGPKATLEDANLIAREELNAAKQAVRAQERELWQAVPQDVRRRTTNTRRTYDEIVAATPRAQQDDISATASRFLNPDSDDAFTGTESVAELQGLRSKLLEEARTARAAGNANEARISGEIADAILTDIGADPTRIKAKGGAELRAALDFSADLNRRFTRGPVGRILATDPSGAARIAPELTLETTVGRGGPRAKVETRALLEAADTPALRGSVEDFLLDDFQRRAVRDGKINERSAKTFMSRHADLLNDFPELQQRFEVAIEADSAAALTAERAEGLAKRLADPKVSRGAIFLKEPVDQAIDRIAKAPQAGEAMREIVKQAGRDPTGDALKGLKSGFGDFLLRTVSTGRETAKGELILSGAALKRLLKDGPVADMAKELLSPEELKRVNTIVSTAEKVSKGAKAKAGKGTIVGDAPSLLFNTIAGIVGAQVGRKVALVTGGGTVQTPGILSRVFRNAVAKIGQDPARRLLIDAMQNKALFEALLTSGASITDKRLVHRQLNAWLISIGAAELGEFDPTNGLTANDVRDMTAEDVSAFIVENIAPGLDPDVLEAMVEKLDPSSEAVQ